MLITEGRNELSVLFTQYGAGDKIEKNEMGGARRANRGGARHVQRFSGET
jgi:hypothetical protein